MGRRPSREAVQKISQKISKNAHRFDFLATRREAIAVEANRNLEKMTYEEKRNLCQNVFSGKTVDGRRMGVWVSWSDDGKKWEYRIEGVLIDETGPVSDAYFERVEDDGSIQKFGNARLQRALVSNSANC